ncbi:unnamed protein product [Ilex paraguariensis]|uniref:Uncharacterized protein n=1 Tax=Ilex paraguariensis TaxID=185542 RepID=A0ABC8V612_9AQUA
MKSPVVELELPNHVHGAGEMESSLEEHQAQPLYPISNEDYNAVEILLMLEDSNPLEVALKSLHCIIDEALRPTSEQEDGVHAKPEAPNQNPRKRRG